MPDARSTHLKFSNIIYTSTSENLAIKADENIYLARSIYDKDHSDGHNKHSKRERNIYNAGRDRRALITNSKLDAGLQKRGTCAFPKNAGLVAITLDQQNGGWAMSPDQPCESGMYCPYACPSGSEMYQWDPSVTSYVSKPPMPPADPQGKPWSMVCTYS
jgi:Beta-glucosidase (SUN family)